MTSPGATLSSFSSHLFVVAAAVAIKKMSDCGLVISLVAGSVRLLAVKTLENRK